MKLGKSKFCIALLFGLALSGQQPFQTVSTVNAPTIAGRPVQTDAGGKLYAHATTTCMIFPAKG